MMLKMSRSIHPGTVKLAESSGSRWKSDSESWVITTGTCDVNFLRTWMFCTDTTDTLFDRVRLWESPLGEAAGFPNRDEKRVESQTGASYERPGAEYQ